MLIDIVIEQGRNHIVCCCYGMEISRKMQVYLLHRQHLCISAPGSTTLHTETRTERRLTQCEHGFLSYLCQSQCQSNRDRCLTNACLCWSDSRYEYKVAFLYSLLINRSVWYLSDIFTIRLQRILTDSYLCRHILDGEQFCFMRNLYVGFHDYGF